MSVTYPDFDAQPEGMFSFAFSAYDLHRPSCRISCQATDEAGARKYAKEWLQGTYWNYDGSSAVANPVNWHVLLDPQGTKLGQFLPVKLSPN